jgi:DNA repair exonuclease SbcCD ATPase subunit
MSKQHLISIKRAVEESRARTAIAKNQPDSKTSSPVHTPLSTSPSPARQYESVQRFSVEDDHEVIVAKRKLSLEHDKLKIEKETLEAEKEALRISKERLEIDQLKKSLDAEAEKKNNHRENEDLAKELQELKAQLAAQEHIKEENRKLSEQIEELKTLTEALIKHQTLKEIVVVNAQKLPDISPEIDHITRIMEQINNTVNKATTMLEDGERAKEAEVVGQLNEFTIL